MTTSQRQALEALIAGQKVIPVIRVDGAREAVPMARALAAGGLPAIEITLRTPGALDAIRAVAAQVPEALVGAGTILDAAQFGQAASAGARFIVSPGFTHGLLEAADDGDVPLLPGATNASDVMALRERGYRFLKFFPAEQSGGVPFLKAMAAPIPDVAFCPTGGVTPKNAPDYLALPNVACVGGSWIVPEDVVASGDWGRVEALAREAASLR